MNHTVLVTFMRRCIFGNSASRTENPTAPILPIIPSILLQSGQSLFAVTQVQRV